MGKLWVSLYKHMVSVDLLRTLFATVCASAFYFVGDIYKFYPYLVIVFGFCLSWALMATVNLSTKDIIDFVKEYFRVKKYLKNDLSYSEKYVLTFILADKNWAPLIPMLPEFQGINPLCENKIIYFEQEVFHTGITPAVRCKLFEATKSVLKRNKKICNLIIKNQ